MPEKTETEQSLQIGKYKIEYDPTDELTICLYDDHDDLIDWWTDKYDARLDVDNSPVGEEITLAQWQLLWDWIEKLPV
jgi:hypothetical protein